MWYRRLLRRWHLEPVPVFWSQMRAERSDQKEEPGSTDLSAEWLMPATLVARSQQRPRPLVGPLGNRMAVQRHLRPPARSTALAEEDGGRALGWCHQQSAYSTTSTRLGRLLLPGRKMVPTQTPTQPGPEKPNGAATVMRGGGQVASEEGASGPALDYLCSTSASRLGQAVLGALIGLASTSALC